jgi:nucleotidyltransferase/DNA polymerase involved in DNA repair
MASRGGGAGAGSPARAHLPTPPPPGSVHAAGGPRVVLHLDLDAFYTQVEIRRLGLPPAHPTAVQQWAGLIATNYPARAAGMNKLTNVLRAAELCPGCTLVHVETIDMGGARHATPPTTAKEAAAALRGGGGRGGGGGGRGGGIDPTASLDDMLAALLGGSGSGSGGGGRGAGGGGGSSSAAATAGGSFHSQATHKSSLSRYRSVSQEIFGLLLEVAGPACVEKASIDEAYVDVTGLASALLGTGGFVEAGTGRAVRGWMGVGDPLAPQPPVAVAASAGGGGGGLRIGGRRFTDGTTSSSAAAPLPVTARPGYAAHAAAAGRAVWAQCARGRWAVIGRDGREVAPRADRLATFTAAATAGGDFELGDGDDGGGVLGLSAAAASAFAVAAAPGVADDLSRVSEARGDAEELAAGAQEAAALALSVGREPAAANVRAFAPPPWLQPSAADALVGALIPPDGPSSALAASSSHHDALLAAGAVVASYIRWRLFTELGFTASVGVSSERAMCQACGRPCACPAVRDLTPHYLSFQLPPLPPLQCCRWRPTKCSPSWARAATNPPGRRWCRRAASPRCWRCCPSSASAAWAAAVASASRPRP